MRPPLITLMFSLVIYFAGYRFISWSSLRNIVSALFIRAITAVAISINLLYALEILPTILISQPVQFDRTTMIYLLVSGIAAIIAQALVALRCPEELSSFSNRFQFQQFYITHLSRSDIEEENARLNQRHHSIAIYKEQSVKEIAYDKLPSTQNNFPIILANYHFDQLNRSTNLQSLRLCFFLVLISVLLFIEPLISRLFVILRALRNSLL